MVFNTCHGYQDFVVDALRDKSTGYLKQIDFKMMLANVWVFVPPTSGA